MWRAGSSRQASLSKFFSLLFSDHFVSPVTNNLFSLNKWKRKNSTKEGAVHKYRSSVCLQMKGTC